MEVLQPPSAAAPAPGAQMAPERRAALKRATSLIPVHAAGTLCESDGGVKPTDQGTRRRVGSDFWSRPCEVCLLSCPPSLLDGLLSRRRSKGSAPFVIATA